MFKRFVCVITLLAQTFVNTTLLILNIHQRSFLIYKDILHDPFIYSIGSVPKYCRPIRLVRAWQGQPLTIKVVKIWLNTMIVEPNTVFWNKRSRLLWLGVCCATVHLHTCIFLVTATSTCVQFRFLFAPPGQSELSLRINPLILMEPDTTILDVDGSSSSFVPEPEPILTRKELTAWYSYAFASEVFAVVSLTTFIPITLEQLSRDNGFLLPDKIIPCTHADNATFIPTPYEDGRCVVYFLGHWIDTASFSLYVFSFSVLVQALTVISIGAGADHGMLFLNIFSSPPRRLRPPFNPP